MIASEIIARFNLQVDDSSELSSTEELALLNQCYREIQNDRSWEWLKTEATATTSISVPYIALPSDFRTLSPNMEGAYQYGNESVVYVGVDYEPFRVINFSNRRDYRDRNGICYIDIPNSRLVFTKQPSSARSVEYDYLMKAPDLITSAEPLFDDAYHEVLAYGMAAKFDAIQLTNKNESYSRENEAMYLSILEQMQMVDSQIKLTIA